MVHVVPQKVPFLPQNVHIFKGLIDKRKTGHFPQKRGIFHYKERNMPPSVQAWPVEQRDGGQVMSNPQKCNILTQIDSNSANIGLFIEPLKK